MYRDIRERTFAFSVQLVGFINTLPETKAARIISTQLIRSGTSVGANVEEATAAFSRNDYAYRMSIALREARETYYWTRLLKATNLVNDNHLEKVEREADEICRILGSIVAKLRGVSRKGN